MISELILAWFSQRISKPQSMSPLQCRYACWVARSVSRQDRTQQWERIGKDDRTLDSSLGKCRLNEHRMLDLLDLWDGGMSLHRV